jgi:hypothetical protein
MNFFEYLLNKSTKFDRDGYALNFGGLVEDVSEMLSSEEAQAALKEARDYIEGQQESRLSNGFPVLQCLEFGNINNAPELVEGQVAAVDGTPVLPLQKYSAGQALCVGIGSRSYIRQMEETLHGYTSKVLLTDISPGETQEYLKRIMEGLYSISQTAYMRYYEVTYALELTEPYVFCDGTLLYEWLVNQDIGRELYKKFMAKKKAIGVMKSLQDNTMFSWLGRALKPGEVFLYETLYEHISQMSNVPYRDRAERVRSEVQWQNDSEFVALSKQIYRGVFKPRNKAFGFECHIDHLNPMLRLMAADCQMNYPGHEIPFLLNRIDLEIRSFFRSNVVKTKISQRLSQDSEILFFGEGYERDFR